MKLLLSSVCKAVCKAWGKFFPLALTSKKNTWTGPHLTYPWMGFNRWNVCGQDTPDARLAHIEYLLEKALIRQGKDFGGGIGRVAEMRWSRWLPRWEMPFGVRGDFLAKMLDFRVLVERKFTSIDIIDGRYIWWPLLWFCQAPVGCLVFILFIRYILWPNGYRTNPKQTLLLRQREVDLR